MYYYIGGKRKGGGAIVGGWPENKNIKIELRNGLF